MKKIILVFIIPILIGLSNVSAEETGTGTNSVPVAVNDIAITNEDTSVQINLTLNDTDVDLDTLIVTGISNMLNGTGTIAISGTGVIFTPTLNFNGTGSFDYIVSDGHLTDTGSVVITVNPVNDAPVAVNDTASTDENTSVVIDLVANDIDVDGDNLVVTTIGTILNGTGVITSSGTGVIFTPDLGFKGLVSFIYTVSDGHFSDMGSVLVSVSEENFPPVAIDDILITNENSPKTMDPRVNDTDADGDILSITGVTNGLHGTVTFTSVSVTYTPNTDFVGGDFFTYTINDGNGGTDTGTVNVTVKENGEPHNNEGNQFKERHMVQAVQKEFIAKFKQLKNQYKGAMGHKESRNEYLRLKEQLRDEYLLRLGEVTGQGKKYSYLGNSAVLSYKNIYKNKYGNTISNMTQPRLQTLIGKIDELIAEINASNRSEETKAKFNTMLLALRELVIEYVDNAENILDIDSLFE